MDNTVIGAKLLKVKRSCVNERTSVTTVPQYYHKAVNTYLRTVSASILNHQSLLFLQCLEISRNARSGNSPCHLLHEGTWGLLELVTMQLRRFMVELLFRICKAPTLETHSVHYRGPSTTNREGKSAVIQLYRGEEIRSDLHCSWLPIQWTYPFYHSLSVHISRGTISQ